MHGLAEKIDIACKYVATRFPRVHPDDVRSAVHDAVMRDIGRGYDGCFIQTAMWRMSAVRRREWRCFRSGYEPLPPLPQNDEGYSRLEDDDERAEAARKLEASGLSPRRVALAKLYLAGHSHESAAETLGVTVTAVRNTFSRMLPQLTARCGGSADEFLRRRAVATAEQRKRRAKR